jgi:hypothetical protein
MNCYIENVYKSIDFNLKAGAEHEWFDKQEFLDKIAARIDLRRTTEPRRSKKTRHGAGKE